MDLKTKLKSPKETEIKKAKEKYYEAVGRRKNAVARVRLFEGSKKIFINDKEYKKYFVLEEFQNIIEDPLKVAGLLNKFKVTIKVKGGGVRGQAEAIRHGIARALVKYKKDLKKLLKSYGFLTRDPRVKERRKYGLKKARRAPQWSKR